MCEVTDVFWPNVKTALCGRFFDDSVWEKRLNNQRAQRAASIAGFTRNLCDV